MRDNTQLKPFLRPWLRLVAHGIEIGLQGGLGLIVFMLAARSADVAAFGQFGFILALASVQQTIAVFGIPAFIYGRIVHRPNRTSGFTWVALVFNGSLSVVLYSMTVFALGALGFYEFLNLYIFAGLRVLGAFSISLTADAQARQAVQEYVPLRIATTLSAITAAVAVWYLEGDIVWFAAVWGIEVLAYAVMLFLFANRRGRVVRSMCPRYRALFTKSAPIAIQSLFIIIYLRFDQIYIQWRFGDVILGIYVAVAKLAEMGNLFVQAFVLFIAPRVIRELYKFSLSRFTCLVLLIAAIGIVSVSTLSAFWGHIVLKLAFGPGYEEGAGILAIYVLSICFVFYGAIGTRACAAKGYSITQMCSGVIGGTSNVILSIFFGEIWGVKGIALATVISYAVAATILWQPFWLLRITNKPSHSVE